jgi:decaprenyl-diphosphate synthase subunit 2
MICQRVLGLAMARNFNQSSSPFFLFQIIFKSEQVRVSSSFSSPYSSTSAFFNSDRTGALNSEWASTLSKAEKIVGYPTSFLSLRYLVSDEVAHFANLLRKLMQTKHPLIKMVRRLISSGNEIDSKRTMQINGLVVLLISKAAGLPKSNRGLLEAEVSDGIHNSQRCLAEIAEMIYMGSMIHKGVLDLSVVESSEHENMDQGNKLAVLCGDYLLANACTNLSKLHNTKVCNE